MKKFYLTAFLVIIFTGTFNYLSSQQLCEQFSSTTFPPTGWTNDNPAFCYRSAVSGFGQGVGSAVFDFWNAPAGNISNLTTLIFQPTITGDSLVMDLAACEDYPSGDSLIILTSTNGGATFVTLVRVILEIPPPILYCLYPFIPTSNEWVKITYGPLPMGTNRIKFRAISGFGNVVYIDSICIKSAISGIVPIKELIPSEFSLSQNYPNPFNPSTKIAFNIPLSRGVAESRGVSVQLKIYDVLGKEITTLVNEQLKPGTYETEFEGTNFPSGVYIYKIEAGTFTDSKKMVLVK